MDRSIGWVATAPHVVQTTVILHLAVAQLPQRLFGDPGTATAAAIQQNLAVRLDPLDARDALFDLIDRNIERPSICPA